MWSGLLVRAGQDRGRGVEHSDGGGDQLGRFGIDEPALWVTSSLQLAAATASNTARFRSSSASPFLA